jgi:ribonuclease HI
MKTWHVYTDGACSINPGLGGWGVHATSDDEVSEWCGGEEDTTNNRMELTAAIMALQNIPYEDDDEIVVYSDSKYVVQGVTEWLSGWKRRGWRKADGNSVMNQDLWRELDAVSNDRSVRWCWVRGHDGNPGNERADELAHEGIEKSIAGSVSAF